MRLDTVITEDEIPAACLLHSMVSSLRPEWNIGIILGSVDDAMEWFVSHEYPELTFLDIHPTNGDTFGLLSVAKPESTIISTITYDQYTIRAFSVSSVGYMLRPADEQRLSDAIVKCETLRGQAWLKSEKYMETLLETLKHPEKEYRGRFFISGTDEFWLLRMEDIAYSYSEEKMTFTVTPGGWEHVLDLSLNKLEEQLDSERSPHVNRQVILNVDAID